VKEPLLNIRLEPPDALHAFAGGDFQWRSTQVSVRDSSQHANRRDKGDGIVTLVNSKRWVSLSTSVWMLPSRTRR
jgi:hypothetical protein